MTNTDSLKIKEVGTATVEAAMAAKAAAQDMGRSVSSRLDEIKTQSAEALHSGAGKVRTAAERGVAAMTGAAENVAGKLDAASSYVNGCEVPSLAGALRRAVIRHPAGTLILAAGVGFCAGTAMSRARTSITKSMKEGKI